MGLDCYHCSNTCSGNEYIGNSRSSSMMMDAYHGTEESSEGGDGIKIYENGISDAYLANKGAYLAPANTEEEKDKKPEEGLSAKLKDEGKKAEFTIEVDNKYAPSNFQFSFSVQSRPEVQSQEPIDKAKVEKTEKDSKLDDLVNKNAGIGYA